MTAPITLAAARRQIARLEAVNHTLRHMVDNRHGQDIDSILESVRRKERIDQAIVILSGEEEAQFGPLRIKAGPAS